MSKIASNKLGDICTVVNGRAYKQNELLNEGLYKVLRVGNFFTNNSWYYSDLELGEDKYCSKGDLLYAWSASFGPRIWNGKKTIYHYHIWKMIPDSTKINKSYLYYYLLEKTQSFMSSTHGSIMLHLTKSFIEELIVKYPTNISTQKQIAKVLSDLDAKIELNNRINTELEAMAKLLYDYWFVQFDFPNKEGKPYKSSGGAMVYNEELKREIPVGWEVTVLSAISNITTGKLDSNAEVVGGVYPFYTCAATPTTIDNYKYDDDVILIAGNNAAGNFHINRFSGKFNAYQRTYIITAKEVKCLDYLYQVLARQMKILKTQGKGSQTKFLTLAMITETQVFEINSNIMIEFSKVANLFYKKQMNILYQNQQLTQLRDWLLPMLMNGQVTVKEAEEMVGELAERSRSIAAETEVEYGD